MQTNFQIIKSYVVALSECIVGYSSAIQMQSIEKKDNNSYWIKGYIDRFYQPTGKIPPEKENQKVAIFYPESKTILWNFRGIEYKKSSEGYID